MLAGFMLMATILGIAIVKKLPKGDWQGWGEIWESFRDAFWGLMLIAIIMIGIYGIPGVTNALFTPTEAAAMGAGGALLLAAAFLGLRRRR